MNLTTGNHRSGNPSSRVASLRLGPAAAWFAALLLVAVSCSDVSDIADQTGSTIEPTTIEVATPADSSDDEASGLTAELITEDAADADESGVGETNEKVSGARSGGSTGTTSRMAALITELPSAPIGAPKLEARQAQPTGLSIGSLGVQTAAVIGVGIEQNGDMEVPPADQVGWYQYGPTPGAEGSSVLAAHIAYNGSNGVFVNLDDIDLGAIIEISYDDGSTKRFETTDKQQYDKNELPKDSVFGRTGEPQLVLITCGGDFNRNLRSYTDNVVVYASPIA